jgi:predicted methyltransferase
MIEDIIRKLKIERQEMDPDVISDYNFILGDLNYRFNSTFEDMVNQNQIEMASKLLPEKDQLTQSMNKKGN